MEFNKIIIQMQIQIYNFIFLSFTVLTGFLFSKKLSHLSLQNIDASDMMEHKEMSHFFNLEVKYKSDSKFPFIVKSVSCWDHCSSHFSPNHVTKDPGDFCK